MNNKLPKSVLYVRCSTLHQNTDRQTNDFGKSLKDNFQHFLEDKESGTIPIFERKNGKLLKVMIDEGTINHIHIGRQSFSNYFIDKRCFSLFKKFDLFLSLLN